MAGPLSASATWAAPIVTAFSLYSFESTSRAADAHPRHLPNRLIPDVARILQSGDEIRAPNRLRTGFPGANPMGRAKLLCNRRERTGKTDGQCSGYKKNPLRV